jgi:type II secretion system protein G
MRRKIFSRGFTLIELLLVIVIIGILATLSSASFFSARIKANDVKRLSDVKQIQFALDRYLEDNGAYPDDAAFIPGGVLANPSDPSHPYLQKIPNNPGGVVDCPYNEYKYTKNSAQSYSLFYCLGNKVSELSPGVCKAMPGLVCIQNVDTSCEDVAKNCGGECALGSTCSGGILFAKNFDTGNGIFDLVVDNKNQSGNGSFRWQDQAGTWQVAGANSLTDGLANSSRLTSSEYLAANICLNLSQNGFSDWYLPAINEITQFCNSSIMPSDWGSRCSSSEDSGNPYSRYLRLNTTCGNIESQQKNYFCNVSCIRHVQ